MWRDFDLFFCFKYKTNKKQASFKNFIIESNSMKLSIKREAKFKI